MIYYLFSGINRKTGFTLEQANYLKKDIPEDASIAFITSIPTDYDRDDEQLLTYIDLFHKIGINFKKYFMIDKRIDQFTAKKIMKEVDLVFLLGGSPELQMNFLVEYELTEVMKTIPMVLGVSAGAMNQGKRVIYRDDFDNHCLKDYPGLGIVDVSIFPHVDLKQPRCLEEVNEIKQIMPLLLLPNDSFVRIENGNTKIIGAYLN